MQLDDNVIRKYCEDANKKKVAAVEEPEVVKEFLKFMQLNQEFFSICSAYDAASFMRSYGFWYNKKDSEPKKFSVNPGEVYYVDLGAFNLKYEEGFLHSCIIVKNTELWYLLFLDHQKNSIEESVTAEWSAKFRSEKS